MLANTIILICFSLCSVVAILEPEGENPGAATRVSVQAFNVITAALLKTLEHEVQVNPYLIPDLHSGDANSNYSITDIVVRHFQVPSSDFTFRSPDEITWSLKNAGFSLALNWAYDEWLLLTSISDDGSANVSVSGLSVDIQVCLRRNEEEQMTLILTKCSATVDEVSLDVDRAIYRLLLKLGLVKMMLERKATRTVCDLVVLAIQEYNCNPMPSKYPVFSAAGYGHSDLVFDYGLIMDPKVTENYVQMSHRGRFMLDRDLRSLLLPAPKMTLPTSKYMFTSAVTNYLFNTLFDAIMRTRYCSMYLTRRDFSFYNVSGSPLNTTCEKDSICFGKFVPEIAKRYPERSVTMMLNLTTRPDLTINKDSFTVTAGYHIAFNVTERIGKEVPVLSLRMSIAVTATARIARSRLFGKLISVEMAFSSASSPFISDTAEFLDRLNRQTKDAMAESIRRVNAVLAYGTPILTKYPYIFLQAIDPQLIFIPGTMIFNVDFAPYSPRN